MESSHTTKSIGLLSKHWVKSWLQTTNSITNDFNGLGLIKIGKKLRLSHVHGQLATDKRAHQITQCKQS
jgi:hypothetical protein